MTRWFRGTVLPATIVCVATIFVSFLIGEIYFRTTKPFLHSTKSAGPGSIIRSTNNVDFWVETRTNKWGFSDREPDLNTDNDVCRIIFIGDSYVEANQVPIKQKSHVVLEKLLNSSPSFKKTRTFALGRSGTGQIEQLFLYDKFARVVKPDIVVLVIVSNDFYDNSPVLRGVHTSINPLHPQISSARIDSTTGKLEWYAGDPYYKDYKIKSPSPKDWRYFIKNGSLLLGRNSYFWSWIVKHTTTRFPNALEFLIVSPSMKDIYSYRINRIENLPGYEGVFEGWNYPNDVSHIEMFFAENMPAVFEEAVSLTGFALDQFLERKEEDGFEILALLTHSLSRKFDGGTQRFGRRMMEGKMRLRWLRLLEERGIDAVDQVEYILANGGAIKDAQFSRDGHWSAQGHKWAAEALFSYLEKDRKFCRN